MSKQKQSRHFAQIRTTGDVREAVGGVFVPCDTSPTYWVRNTKGDIVAMSKSERQQLARLIGKPRYAQRPQPTQVDNPIRAAMQEKDRWRRQDKGRHHKPRQSGF